MFINAEASFSNMASMVHFKFLIGNMGIDIFHDDIVGLFLFGFSDGRVEKMFVMFLHCIFNILWEQYYTISKWRRFENGFLIVLVPNSPHFCATGDLEINTGDKIRQKVATKEYVPILSSTPSLFPSISASNNNTLIFPESWNSKRPTVIDTNIYSAVT